MKKLVLPAMTLILSACASTPNRSTEISIDSAQPAYVVRDRNLDPAPEWIRDFPKWKRQVEGSGQHYFLGESGDVNDRVAGCEYSNLVAKRKIAQQIAELISSKVAINKQGRLMVDPAEPNDVGLQRAFEEQIASKSIAFLSGVKEYGSFWELRDYSKSNGNKRVFNCATLVVISDKDLQVAMQKSRQKAIEATVDVDARTAVREALKDIEKDFSTYQPRTN